MIIDSQLPSQYLPSLRPIPTSASLLIFLYRLEKLVNPSNVIIDLVDPGDIEADFQLEEFELNFARGWLDRTLVVASRKVGEGEEWTELLDGIASLLSSMSGHGAAGASTSTYLLPTFDPLHPTTSITIQETTLISSSTGFRTWGSAAQLAKAITLNPSSFFPLSPPTTILAEPLRVLELGSGTGLSAIASIKMLELMKIKVEVVLTDYEPEILVNLQHNLNLNFTSESTSSFVTVKVNHLDWLSYHSPSTPSLLACHRFPVILASDVVFEPHHATLIQSVVLSLLSFPSSSHPNPTFHLILPLRHTHSKEHNGFDQLFTVSGIDERQGGNIVEDLEGRKWRLKTMKRETLKGRDGFGSNYDNKENSEYWLYRIGWERL